MIHTVPLERSLPQPWRNGGGSTQELLTWPAPDSWLVRISVARIEQNGPFSRFEGVERWFAVIDGEGVTLRFAETAVALRPGDQPLRFDGAAAPDCELLHDATQDLNLMVRSASGDGAMRLATACVPWESAASWRAVYTAEEVTLHIDGRIQAVLPANTLAWAEHQGQQSWELTGGGDVLRAWWMAFAG
jgi:uncharacterized protein